MHAVDVLEDALHAPEAAAGEHRDLGAGRRGRRVQRRGGDGDALLGERGERDGRRAASSRAAPERPGSALVMSFSPVRVVRRRPA